MHGTSAETPGSEDEAACAQLVVADDDRVTVWNYDTDTWADIACAVAGRNLTTEEWEQLGPRTIEYRATCEQYPIDDGPT